MKILCILLLPFFVHAERVQHIYGSSNGNDIEQPITHIQLYGERNSGTNFFEVLLKKNIQGINNNFFGSSEELGEKNQESLLK